MSESGMRVQRRYLMEVKPFTPKVPVYELRIEVLSQVDRVVVRVLELRDSGRMRPMVDLYEYEVHAEVVEFQTLGWGLQDLARALDAEQLRGSIERNAAHQLFLAIATNTKEPHGFAKPWAYEWLPEWATWWDKTMTRFRASEAVK